ncbi:hypothetical protein [Bacillus sp. MRMR6]|uniref:hypothetical protein n=1 Tax=Bacillus sp. MRMR6 TaxID=1928617 RepID=UPI00095115F7|nr:hypothetical protein [Bacillus sp. MRMR6]OLS40823.1 hypothetical protein BTR25_08015 [Bacillus sp. MRMR6]
MSKNKKKKSNHKQQEAAPSVSKVAKRYIKNNIIGDYGLYSFGTCPSCKKGNAQLIADAENVPIVLFIENLYQVNSFDYIDCEICETRYFPKFMQVRNMDTQEVILNDPLKNIGKKQEVFPSNDPTDSMLNNLIENQEFFNTFIDICLEYYDSIIKELKNDEIKAALERMKPDAILPSNASLLRKYVKNFILEQDEKVQFLQQVCQEFLLELFRRNPVSGWVTNSFISEYGFHRLFIALAYAPLPLELEIHRYRALRQLQETNAKPFDKLAGTLPHIPVVLSMMSEQEYWSSTATKFEQENEQLKARLKELESKLGTAYDQIERNKQITERSERSLEDIQKIKELKGFINELKEELDRLYSIVEKEEVHDAIEEEVQVIEDKPETDFNPNSLSMLQDKTVALIGGVRTKEHQSKIDSITILAHDGRKLDPTYHQTIQQADIIILITTYCSHETMWLTKATALANDKVILFEKNINVPLLLQKANEFLMKKENVISKD